MKLTIEINGDCGAFWDDEKEEPIINSPEYARILRNLSDMFTYNTSSNISGKLHDINGNTVGHFKLSEED